MSKSGMGILLVLALAGVMSSERQAHASAWWHYEMIAANETPFLGQGWFRIRHTWSRVWTQPWDSTASWHSGVDRCGPTYGTSACKGAYRSRDFTFYSPWWTDNQSVRWYLDHRVRAVRARARRVHRRRCRPRRRVRVGRRRDDLPRRDRRAAGGRSTQAATGARKPHAQARGLQPPRSGRRPRDRSEPP